MKILVIDGQGGRMGRAVIEQLKVHLPEQEVLAIGTNSIATAAMLKGGATYGATGENPVVYNSKQADIIIGPIGIISANALYGEVTPIMAQAVGESPAKKLLIPVNKCSIYVVGTKDMGLNEYIELVIQQVRYQLNGYKC